MTGFLSMNISFRVRMLSSRCSIVTWNHKVQDSLRFYFLRLSFVFQTHLTPATGGDRLGQLRHVLVELVPADAQGFCLRLKCFNFQCFGKSTTISNLSFSKALPDLVVLVQGVVQPVSFLLRVLGLQVRQLKTVNFPLEILRQQVLSNSLVVTFTLVLARSWQACTLVLGFWTSIAIRSPTFSSSSSIAVMRSWWRISLTNTSSI